jgi:glycosyltransferase involved in cell wall biosynthesis
MRIAIIASARYPIKEPFAGGLEAQTYWLAKLLRKRGHKVTVFASSESDPDLGVEAVCEKASELVFSQAALDDASALPAAFMKEHHAYMNLMLRLSRSNFDVVHNNSLHYLPIAMAPGINAPVLTALHTPPIPWLESAVRSRPEPDNTVYVAVSEHTRRSWGHVLDVRAVVPNGIEISQWTFSANPITGRAAWVGRITPEKGTHLAIEAAHAAGMSIHIAGPVSDRAYFYDAVAPALCADDRAEGHVSQKRLDEIWGSASVTFVTPRWEEPYGLVVAESLACGTPVAAFRRGGIPEVLSDETGILASPDDVEELATAAIEAANLDRRECRNWADVHCSVNTMVDRYEDLYLQLAS